MSKKELRCTVHLKPIYMTAKRLLNQYNCYGWVGYFNATLCNALNDLLGFQFVMFLIVKILSRTIIIWLRFQLEESTFEDDVDELTPSLMVTSKASHVEKTIATTTTNGATEGRLYGPIDKVRYLFWLFNRTFVVLVPLERLAWDSTLSLRRQFISQTSLYFWKIANLLFCLLSRTSNLRRVKKWSKSHQVS